MSTKRSVVDYSLARRAVLADLHAGRATTTDVCDAHPYLLRAARFHGEPTRLDCPVCRRERLTNVTYTYGDCFAAATNGRVRTTRDLIELADQHAEFRVYVVEVCRGCGWNHLTVSYLLGTAGRPARPARTRVTDRRGVALPEPEREPTRRRRARGAAED